MTQQDRNALKKLKRKYPELSRVGNNNKQEDQRRQKIMMSTEDYELYLKLTNQKRGNNGPTTITNINFYSGLSIRNSSNN